MTFDTLEHNGVERSFAQWRFEHRSVQLSRHNLREDVFRATVAGVNISDDATFPFEAEVIVRTGRESAEGNDNSFSGGVTKFSGKRVGMEAAATGHGQGVTYEFLGPWYDLANTHYLQTFQGAAVLPYAPGEIVLNTSTANAVRNLSFISMGDQLQAILQWLLDQYAAQGMTAPFQYLGRDLHAGAVDLSVTGTATVGVNTDKAATRLIFTSTPVPRSMPRYTHNSSRVISPSR